MKNGALTVQESRPLMLHRLLKLPAQLIDETKAGKQVVMDCH